MSRGYRERVYARYYTTTFSQNDVSDAGYDMRARILRQLMLPYLPESRDARILEVACGPGYALHALQTAGYKNVRGVDVSAQQVELARRRGLPAEEGDAFAYLSGERETFDAIIAFDFIEHLDRDELFRFFDLARVALKLGGRLFVRTANANSLLAARIRWIDLTHELSFTDHSLRAAFLTCDLHPVSIHGQSYVPFTLGGFARGLVAAVVRGLWKIYLIAELGREGLGLPTQVPLIGVAERRPSSVDPSASERA
jgi:SAM-dependent methyltransferase